MDWRLEKRRESFAWLVKNVEQIISPEKWGFRESYRYIDIDSFPYVIYDSEWCRVKFSRTPGEVWAQSGIGVSYGRLHARNDGDYVYWNGEKCHSWHRIYDALRFLDGLTPEEAIYQMHHKDEQSSIINQFRKKKHDDHPEWMLEMQAAIWKYYGTRLFELFDLRMPDLWERFKSFLQEYYKIMGWQPPPPHTGVESPPPYKIC